MTQLTARPRPLRNKVPDPTPSFWIIKVLATTVGETAADLLSDTLGFGLPLTTAVMAAVLVVFLVLQFRARRLGRRVLGHGRADQHCRDLHHGQPHRRARRSPGCEHDRVRGRSRRGFIVWYRTRAHASIHKIDTARREAFYWLAILFTFALGTAAGDLIAEQTGLGYLPSLLLFAAAIATSLPSGSSAVAAPSPASGSRTSSPARSAPRPGTCSRQPTHDGGLGIGTITTSIVFLAVIAALIASISVGRHERVRTDAHEQLSS